MRISELKKLEEKALQAMYQLEKNNYKSYKISDVVDMNVWVSHVNYKNDKPNWSCSFYIKNILNSMLSYGIFGLQYEQYVKPKLTNEQDKRVQYIRQQMEKYIKNELENLPE